MKVRASGTVRWLLAAIVVGLGPGCAGLRDRMGGSAGAPPRQPQLSASSISLATGSTQAAPRPGGTPAAQPPAETSIGDRAPYRLRVGDPVLIYLRAIFPKDEDVEDVVDERGYVTLPHLDDVYAMGKTVSELERDIQRLYIEKQIYRNVTVNVVTPAQSFFVQGEVRLPQRYALISGMTVLQAIAAAGGYTDYADRKRIALTRGGKVIELNMRDIERDPKKDVPVESGDVIRVLRSRF